MSLNKHCDVTTLSIDNDWRKKWTLVIWQESRWIKCKIYRILGVFSIWSKSTEDLWIKLRVKNILDNLFIWSKFPKDLWIRLKWNNNLFILWYPRTIKIWDNYIEIALNYTNKEKSEYSIKISVNWLDFFEIDLEESVLDKANENKITPLWNQDFIFSKRKKNKE